MPAVSPYEMRLPLGIEDVEDRLTQARDAVEEAKSALSFALNAVGFGEWSELHCQLTTALETLADAVAALNECKEPARAWDHATQPDW